MKFQKGHAPWNKAKPIIKKCEICGKEFTVCPARMKKARFCSKICQNKSKIGFVPWNKGKGKKKEKVKLI